MATALILSAMLVAIAWLWLRFAKREVSLPLWSTLELPQLAPEALPFVSIVVAAGNRARDLERCVQSLMRQDYWRFEVIVVDASSSDEIREQLLEMQTTADGSLRVLRGERADLEHLRDPRASAGGIAVRLSDRRRWRARRRS